jgi:hypothetical protein
MELVTRLRVTPRPSYGALPALPEGPPLVVESVASPSGRTATIATLDTARPPFDPVRLLRQMWILCAILCLTCVVATVVTLLVDDLSAAANISQLASLVLGILAVLLSLVQLTVTLMLAPFWLPTVFRQSRRREEQRVARQRARNVRGAQRAVLQARRTSRLTKTCAYRRIGALAAVAALGIYLIAIRTEWLPVVWLLMP